VLIALIVRSFQEEKTNLCEGQCEATCTHHIASSISITGLIETSL
jgi:hypothetical protein